MGNEEVTSGRAVKLMAVITLQAFDSCAKLGGNTGEKVSVGGKRVGLCPHMV